MFYPLGRLPNAKRYANYRSTISPQPMGDGESGSLTLSSDLSTTGRMSASWFGSLIKACTSSRAAASFYVPPNSS